MTKTPQEVLKATQAYLDKKQKIEANKREKLKNEIHDIKKEIIDNYGKEVGAVIETIYLLQGDNIKIKGIDTNLSGEPGLKGIPKGVTSICLEWECGDFVCLAISTEDYLRVKVGENRVFPESKGNSQIETLESEKKALNNIKRILPKINAFLTTQASAALQYAKQIKN